ncbi:MAG: NYN domain-containing protein [Planctomycetota bacterium]|nr:NYN domain-containing protein [Planctomycetota bacterium]
MRLLVDTFNVLHVTGVLPPGLAGPDVAGLAALVASSRWADAHVALVCDGAPPGGNPQKMPSKTRVIYSGKIEADEVLERLIADSSAPSRLLVVSSDRRVRRAARRRGAKDLDATTFLRVLLEDRRQVRGQPGEIHRPATLRPGEVETWRSEFELGAESFSVSDEDLPPHLQESQDAEPPVSPKAPQREASPEYDPASFLPPELLEEARRLLGSKQPAPSSEPPADQPPPKPSSPKPAQDMPADIIREAEDMLHDPPPEP